MSRISKHPVHNDTFRTRMRTVGVEPLRSSRNRSQGIVDSQKSFENRVLELARKSHLDSGLRAMATRIAYTTGDSSRLGIISIERILQRLAEQGKIKILKQGDQKRGRIN